MLSSCFKFSRVVSSLSITSKLRKGSHGEDITSNAVHGTILLGTPVPRAHLGARLVLISM